MAVVNVTLACLSRVPSATRWLSPPSEWTGVPQNRGHHCRQMMWTRAMSVLPRTLVGLTMIRSTASDSRGSKPPTSPDFDTALSSRWNAGRFPLYADRSSSSYTTTGTPGHLRAHMAVQSAACRATPTLVSKGSAEIRTYTALCWALIVGTVADRTCARESRARRTTTNQRSWARRRGRCCPRPLPAVLHHQSRSHLRCTPGDSNPSGRPAEAGQRTRTANRNRCYSRPMIPASPIISVFGRRGGPSTVGSIPQNMHHPVPVPGSSRSTTSPSATLCRSCRGESPTRNRPMTRREAPGRADVAPPTRGQMVLDLTHDTNLS